MPRALRIHVSGAFYHVTMRGNHRQAIFFRPADRQLLNHIVAEVIDVDRGSDREHTLAVRVNGCTT
jgi:REP element-mobilizing transposase RayT